jgi:pyruvate dehydrogenase E2 component (dihydrolipoamide acetyltransferase)
MPALEMAQETGKLIRWLKHEGDAVAKGEPVMEVETDKVTVEIEATASGTLGGIIAREGDDIQVGRTIAWILAPGESAPTASASTAPTATGRTLAVVTASPVARRIAEEHGIDLATVKPAGGRIEKADMLAYIEQRTANTSSSDATQQTSANRLIPASPKARRLAAERGIDLVRVSGSGPDGAVLVADVSAAVPLIPKTPVVTTSPQPAEVESLSNAWRVMAERVTTSWTSVPHFYLMREVSARSLVDMRARITPAIEKRISLKPTYTDLLIKLVAAALRDHPRLNASWINGEIRLNHEINVGIATAIDDGLIVPVIQRADELSIGEITTQRNNLVTRANANKLRPADIAGGTFTITNLGMYHVDIFNAIINAPQAAILAVGRIADRVVPINGEPAIRPMMILSLACDHRVVDGARAAKFLDDLANLIEEPWGILA